MAQDVPRFGNKYTKNLIKYRQIYIVEQQLKYLLSTIYYQLKICVMFYIKLTLMIEEVEEHSTDGGEGCAAGAKEREHSTGTFFEEGIQRIWVRK